MNHQNLIDFSIKTMAYFFSLAVAFGCGIIVGVVMILGPIG